MVLILVFFSSGNKGGQEQIGGFYSRHGCCGIGFGSRSGGKKGIQGRCGCLGRSQGDNISRQGMMRCFFFFFLQRLQWWVFLTQGTLRMVMVMIGCVMTRVVVATTTTTNL